MNKPLPHLTTDAEAQRFVEEADLSQFDLPVFKAHSIEFAPKSGQAKMHNGVGTVGNVSRICK